MNLASTVQAALACGLTVFVALELSGSLAAALIASLVLAGSYTFWSQAVTTEVYALHILCLALVLLVLWAWEHRPTFGRLLLFFFVYSHRLRQPPDDDPAPAGTGGLLPVDRTSRRT